MRVSSWGDECESWWYVICYGKKTKRDMGIL